MAQLAADQLGVALEDVSVVQGDTAGTAYATGSYGSRTAVIGGGATIRAAGDVRDEAARLAAHLLEASPDDLELADGRISVRGAPDRSVTIRERRDGGLLGPAARRHGARRSTRRAATTRRRRIRTPASPSSSRSTPRRAQVRIERIVAVEDCGTVLNPAVVEGQVIGAIAQGIGGALLEELRLRRGRAASSPARSSTSSTRPRRRCPRSRSTTSRRRRRSPRAASRAWARAGLIGAPSAIVNAISDALGVPVDRTPLRPCDVLELVAAASA